MLPETQGDSSHSPFDGNPKDSEKARQLALVIPDPDRDADLVTWDVNDPQNPRNWSLKKKWHVIGTLSLNAWCCGMCSTIVAPAFSEIQLALHTSTEVSILAVSLTVLGWTVGPLVSSPASEIWGRNMVYISTWSAFVLFNLGSALSQNIASLLICRFFAGVFVSPITSIAPASAYDMFEVKDVGPPAFLLSIAAMLGSTLGEVLGGFLTQYAGWRWTLWFLLIVSGVSLVAQALIPETHANTILTRKVRRLRNQTGNERLHTEMDRHNVQKAVIFKTAVWRPLQMLILEPIVLFSALSLAFVWGVLYLYLGAYLLVFSRVYGFKEGPAGAAFSGISIGVLLGMTTAPVANKVYQNLTLRHGDGIYPEARLPVAMVAVFCFPISIFWFSWSASRDVHWIVPVLSGVPFGIGQGLLFVRASSSSLPFPHLGASVSAATSVLRYLFAMTFPLLIPRIYARLSTEWATSIFGFLSLAFVPIPFLLYRYGPFLRSKSRFTPRFV